MFSWNFFYVLAGPRNVNVVRAIVPETGVFCVGLPGYIRSTFVGTEGVAVGVGSSKGVGLCV